MKSRTLYLLIIFCAVVVIAVILIGSKYYFTTLKQLDSQHELLTTEVEELHEVTQELDLWERRNAYITANIETADSDQEMRLAMSELTALTENATFKITNREYLEVENIAHYDIAKVKITATGQLFQVLPWLQQLVENEKLLSVHYLNIAQGESKEGDANYTIELHKFYATK